MDEINESEMINILKDNILEEIHNHLDRAVQLFDDLKERDVTSSPMSIFTAYGNTKINLEYTRKSNLKIKIHNAKNIH